MASTRRSPWLAVAILAGCTFDPGSFGPGNPDASIAMIDSATPIPDAPPDVNMTPDVPIIDACVPGCADSDHTHPCTGPDQNCMGYGCSTTGTPHCRVQVPSNGGTSAMTVGTGAVSFTGATPYFVNSDTGLIMQGATVIRTGVTGINAGMNFQLVGNVGVLSMASLTTATGTLVQVAGPRPLLIISAGDVTVHGKIDVGGGFCVNVAVFSNNGHCGGPGGGEGGFGSTLATGCGGVATAGNGQGGPGDGNPARTGGGGGAMAIAGEAGGNSNGGHTGGTAGVATNCPAGSLSAIAGGGGGGRGGGGGNGGGAGGALQITSFTRIDINGTGAGLAAGGAGGGAGGTGGSGGGGGGAGAGGAILLEAPIVTLDSSTILAANGGAGGEGNGTSTGGSGPFGDTGATCADTGGNPGGNGGFLTTAPVSGTAGGNNGSGGGGAAYGIIRVNFITSYTPSTAKISPPVTMGAPPLQ